MQTNTKENKLELIKWKNHHIENVEIDVLLFALKERYGYDFSGYARASLKRRLMELKRYFDVSHLSEIIPEMLFNEAVAQAVINNISIPTSDFFRDPFVWKYIRNTVLPWLSGFPRINIWQVGCGHGEETYTLSILLQEAGLSNRSRIFTSDINPSFLDDAKTGRWSKGKIELWTENYKNSGGLDSFSNFFIEQGDRISIREDLKESIEFIQHNLVVDEVFKEVQFVVCRNVMIYFGESLQNRVIKLFCRSLERGGYLLLGRSERIMNLEITPNLVEFDHRFQIYRKNFGGDDHV